MISDISANQMIEQSKPSRRFDPRMPSSTCISYRTNLSAIRTLAASSYGIYSQRIRSLFRSILGSGSAWMVWQQNCLHLRVLRSHCEVVVAIITTTKLRTFPLQYRPSAKIEQSNHPSLGYLLTPYLSLFSQLRYCHFANYHLLDSLSFAKQLCYYTC